MNTWKKELTLCTRIHKPINISRIWPTWLSLLDVCSRLGGFDLLRVSVLVEAPLWLNKVRSRWIIRRVEEISVGVRRGKGVLEWDQWKYWESLMCATSYWGLNRESSVEKRPFMTREQRPSVRWSTTFWTALKPMFRILELLRRDYKTKRELQRR